MHSPIGASSAKRILACPGSVKLISSLPTVPKQESIYAEEGTKAHEVAEKFFLEQEIPSWATEEMLDGAKLYAGTIDFFLTMEGAERSHVKLEDQIKWKGIANAFGTCDSYFVFGHTLYIFDYKFGKGVKVEGKDNPQLLWYANAVRSNLKYTPKNYVLVIVQPRNGGVSVWECGNPELDAFRNQFIDALRCDDFNVSENCKWCPALPHCDAHKNKVAEVFDICLDENVKLCNIEDVQSSKLKLYLDNSYLLEGWVSAIREHAFTQMAKGLHVDGYKLEESLSNRKWINEKEVESKYKDQDIYKKTLKTPAQMEKIIGKDIVNELTIREQKGKKLVKSSNNNILDAFDEI